MINIHIDTVRVVCKSDVRSRSNFVQKYNDLIAWLFQGWVRIEFPIIFNPSNWDIVFLYSFVVADINHSSLAITHNNFGLTFTFTDLINHFSKCLGCTFTDKSAYFILPFRISFFEQVCGVKVIS